MLLWQLLKKRKNKDEVELESFLTKHNEGILISEEEAPGLLNGKKEDLAKLLGIAIDRQLLENKETVNHIFFLLKKDDLDIFSDEVLEVIGDKHVWLFIEGNGNAKPNKKIERIGKVILFDPEYMRTCGKPAMVLGIIPRFLSLISRDGDMNLDHVYEGLPDLCTLSYSFPTDVHASLASVLKHQKFFSMNHGEDVMQITNSKNFARDTGGFVKFVNAETEPFFISFKEVT